jgi:hypothetical protein
LAPVFLENPLLPLQTAKGTDVRDREGKKVLILIPIAEIELPQLKTESAAIRVVGRLNEVV